MFASFLNFRIPNKINNKSYTNGLLSYHKEIFKTMAKSLGGCKWQEQHARQQEEDGLIN